MGNENVQLCKDLFSKLINISPEYFPLHSVVSIDEKNRRIFDDTKLEAHHAIIPLDRLPVTATVEEEDVYGLILERFMLAFAPVCKIEKLAVMLEVNGCTYRVFGNRFIDKGWKNYRRVTASTEEVHFPAY